MIMMMIIMMMFQLMMLMMSQAGEIVTNGDADKSMSTQAGREGEGGGSI